ncbi:hypothetical protein E9998_13185 [Glycomyces paridis]|uniref:Uncharacterized protein n=1 Tax=Glycomyces paridis TaxID=2126555 RepID=A0A4S8PC88_9ACTN|nr:hypothetical protein E9998_13185 [Glycomyces paridis]
MPHLPALGLRAALRRPRRSRPDPVHLRRRRRRRPRRRRPRRRHRHVARDRAHPPLGRPVPAGRLRVDSDTR